jgi:OOP family OmpA-OmpF porin
LVVAVSLVTLGCASGGALSLGGSRATCITVAGVIGGIGGSVLANQSDPRETDERLAKGALGVAAGTALGYAICGEAGRVVLPDVAIRATPRTGEVPLEVDMQAQLPRGDGGDRYRYEWKLGDGTTAQGPRVAHVYEEAGTYQPELWLIGPEGQRKQATTRILARAPQPAAPPSVDVAPPPAEPPAPPERIVLRDVAFAFDSARPVDGATFESVAEKLRASPDATVLVMGHTDSVGPEAYNLKLSEERAGAVVDELVERGIERSRFEIAPRGEREPTAPNDTESGRAENRRVELEIIR